MKTVVFFCIINEDRSVDEDMIVDEDSSVYSAVLMGA